jgi:ankyrin repeat protein
MDGGRTLLHEAIKVGNTEAVVCLLEKEKVKEQMLEVRDSTGATPLIAALRLPRPLKIVELLVTKHLADLGATDGCGRTALDLASALSATHPESSLLCKLLGQK